MSISLYVTVTEIPYSSGKYVKFEQTEIKILELQINHIIICLHCNKE